jgi:Baseplate J-like protein
MPLPLPDLDDRRWADLVEEGRALIPLHAPEWTDHNLHDPGITLIELLAWVTEMDVYQLNRVPDRHRRKFLALVGLQPAVFSLLDALTLVTGQLQAVQARTGQGFEDLTGPWRRGEPVAPLGRDPRPGDTLYLGFDQPLARAVTASLMLAFAGPADQLDTPHHSVRTVWELLTGPGSWRPLDPGAGELVDETRGLTRDGRVLLTPPAASVSARLGAVDAPLHWLRCRLASGAHDAAPVLRAAALNAAPAEQTAAVASRFPIARGVVAQGPEPAVGQPTRLRLRLDPQGQIDQLRFAPDERGLPRFRVLELRPATAGRTGALGLEAAFLGVSTGRPLQRLPAGGQIVQASFRPWTLELDTWHRWAVRPDLDGSGRADEHLTLDAAEGVAAFGDGEHGRVPPTGALVFALARTTRAEAGNLAAGTVRRLADTPHNRALVELDSTAADLAEIINPLPAGGGAAAETLDHAAGRAAELVERPQRAVTLADFEQLAAETPGTRLARVSARANLHPAFPCFTAPGMVTVVVVPSLPAGRPSPSAGLLRAVAAHLCARRVVGTRVEVVGPAYREVAVHARVRALPGVAADDLGRRVAAALDRFLDPLEGGPSGGGWPFGRDVYRSEVLQVIDETPGVDHVLALELLPDGGEVACGNVCLGPLGLVAAGGHRIEVG